MNLQDLSSIKERILADVLEPTEKTRVLVGLATCGIASGAAPVMDKFKALAEGRLEYDPDAKCDHQGHEEGHECGHGDHECGHGNCHK